METQEPKPEQAGEIPNHGAPKIPINPVDIALKSAYGFGLPLTGGDNTAKLGKGEQTTPQSVPDKDGKEKADKRKIEFEGPDVMVQRLVFGRPLVIIKEPEDTAKEELTTYESQPEPEPKPELEPTTVPVPTNQEVVPIDHDRAIRFYEQLKQADKKIDSQENALNLQTIKELSGFKDVDTTIQKLALEYSKEDFDPQVYHLLTLQEISEKLTTELEEKTGWDNTVHQDNVAAVGLALNIEINNLTSQILRQPEPVQLSPLLTKEVVRPAPSTPPPSERPVPPSSEPLPSSIEPVIESKPGLPIIIPDNTPGNNFEKVLNHILESSQNSTEQIGVNPDVFIRYLQHTIKFPRGVGFKGTPSARITKDEGKNILTTKGSIRGGIGPITKGEVNFTITLRDNDQGGVEIIYKSIDYSGETAKRKAEVEEKLGSLNQTIIDQINGRLNQFWEVAHFRIADYKLIFDFRKKQ